MSYSIKIGSVKKTATVTPNPFVGIEGIELGSADKVYNDDIMME